MFNITIPQYVAFQIIDNPGVHVRVRDEVRTQILNNLFKQARERVEKRNSLKAFSS